MVVEQENSDRLYVGLLGVDWGIHLDVELGRYLHANGSHVLSLMRAEYLTSEIQSRSFFGSGEENPRNALAISGNLL